MLPIQLEGRQVVVKRGWLPAPGGVAGSTVLPELAVVVVVFLMTCKASGGCALENIVDVAVAAFHFEMPAFKLEGREVMIEGGGRPSRGLVTGATVFPKVALVGIVLQVARNAIAGRGLEIGGSMRPQVTLVTGRPDVFAFQLEDCAAVIEFPANRLDAVVATLAIRAIGKGMLLHKDSIDLLVAGAADGRVEPGDIRAMTVGAGKRLPVAAMLVGVEGVTGGVVRESA